MKEKNDYGMYSGAFIFDAMDRAALKYVRETGALPKKTVLVTKWAHNVEFRRQVCSKDFKVHCYGLSVTRAGFWCQAEIEQDGVLCASADFLFCIAKNYCAA